MEEIKEQEKKFEVDGVIVSLQEFQEKINNPKIQLREIEPGKWKTFERMYG
jgi:hypothetical protein